MVRTGPRGLYDVQGEQLVDGRFAEVPPQITNDVPHTFRVLVQLQDDRADIQMVFDGVPQLAWKDSRIAGRSGYFAMPRTETLGLGAQTPVVFHAAELRMPDGNASAQRFLPPKDEWTDPIATIQTRGGSIETNDQGQVVGVAVNGRWHPNQGSRIGAPRPVPGAQIIAYRWE